MNTIRQLIQFCGLCLCAGALIVGAAGCVVMPTPHRDTGDARTNLTLLTPQQFTPARSTREDVILSLGEPDAVSADESKLAYRTEKTVAVWLMLIGGGYSADLLGGAVNKDQFFVFEFDSKGNFQRTARAGRFLGNMVLGPDSLMNKEYPGETVVAQPLPDQGKTNIVPAIVAREHIQADFPNAVWLAGVNGLKSSKERESIGVRGRLFITDSAVEFVTVSQFANADPALQLPLDAVVRASVDKHLLGRRLVLETQAGQFHSFDIFKPGSRLFVDKAAMQTAREFIQSKIKPNPLQK